MSVVNNLVLAAGHRTGLLVALDAESGDVRWISRAPNWIHQDPVSDGNVIVVGFGDKYGSFMRAAPSGIAAFRARDGHRLWTVFDESSVMTSPIIHDSVLVYATSAGMLRERLLASGELLEERRLPGGAIMAPPVMAGDVILLTLDVHAACAFALEGLTQLWCREFDGWRGFGHASAAVAGGQVVLSGIGTAVTTPLSTYVSLPIRSQVRLLRELLFPTYWARNTPGQEVFGLDLFTGETRWHSPYFAQRRVVGGHVAGTAVMLDSLAVIVLPVADTLVALEAATGAVRWSTGAQGARGPVLVAGGRVILAGADGVIAVRRLATGDLDCRVRRSVGWDRAGPVLVGDLVVFADLEGTVEAIRLTDLLNCTAEGASPAAR